MFELRASPHPPIPVFPQSCTFLRSGECRRGDKHTAASSLRDESWEKKATHDMHRQPRHRSHVLADLVPLPAGPTPSASGAAAPASGSGSRGGVLMVESPSAAGLELYPLTSSRGRGAMFDAEDTSAADRALAALAAPVLVLDEIDAGTGARLGGSVGRMLHGIAAASGQVLCVSHVPQVPPSVLNALDSCYPDQQCIRSDSPCGSFAWWGRGDLR